MVEPDDDQDRIRDRVDEWLSGFMHKLRVGKDWCKDEKRMQVPTLTSVGLDFLSVLRYASLT